MKPRKLLVASISLFLCLAALASAFPRPNDEKATLTHKQLKALIASAKTPADHQRLAAYYQQEAKRLAARAKEHEEMAAEYEKRPVPYESKNPGTIPGAIHCQNFAKLYKQEAEEAQALAAIHEEMAKEAGTQK